mmetsp:Transcript_16235/g.35307  ORF Transcript_16235/g.35307 Transcript_16235/m.35307 type:complete len:156 (-) Transcript_16235:572-1039(-)
MPPPHQINMSNPDDVSGALDAMHKLLGSNIRCTLDDGRNLDGTFLCLDRLKNIIISDATETRKVPLADYGAYLEYLDPPSMDEIKERGGRVGTSSSPGDIPVVDEDGCVVVTRKLAQACAPGARLVKVEVTRTAWEKSQSSSSSSSPLSSLSATQ